ncbi:PKD domain-containing protein [Nocardioides iriomotensis]|uniref:PKD domain-containing protein n=1 Tax=Nocardioides iriomotensis TaxID=715784 RepID=UPI00197F7D4E|nr:hypothetical protein [Nocardioides iriomotensis]
MKALARISTTLLAPALVAAAALSPVLRTAPPEPAPRAVEPVLDGALQKIHSFPTLEVGLPHPTSLAWSRRLGALVITGAARPHAPKAVGTDATDLGRFRGTAHAKAAPRDVLGARGHDLRGRATHPETGEVFTYDATTDQLLGTRNGLVTSRYDASDLGVDDVRGVVLAPSNDPTDGLSELSIYVLDNGAPGNFGEVVEAMFATDLQLVAAITPSSIRTVATSSYSPPSPDPSGVAYLPGRDQLFIADGEVDEMSIFRNVNLYATTRTGTLQSTGVSQPWSDEPVGVGYNPSNDHLFVTDDDEKMLFEIVAGADNRFGTPDDTVSGFNVQARGVNDPEGVDYDVATNALWFAGGESSDVHRVRAGSDGRFGTSDDVWQHWNASVFGAQDPEGMGFDQVRGTALLLDDSSETIYELDRNTGALINTIDVSSANMTAAAGLAVAPASSGSGQRTYYVVARGQDNDSNPNENDGRMYEITASLPPIGGGPSNLPPNVDAGADSSVVLPASANLDGTVSDDGLPTNPGTVTTTWTQVSGPGDVTFGNPGAVDTTASFSVAGSYVLRLSATDGALTTADEVTIFAAPVGGALVREVRAVAGSDDAEQGATSGNTNIGSSDLELTTDGNTQQVVGVRFPGLTVPRGASIVRAYLQFWTDEVSTGASAMTVRAEASDNAAPYTATASNVSSRATTAGVPWNPPDWPTVGQAGAPQRTSDLSAQVQAVVNRTGWSSGNAMAFQFSGTGRRTARAVESGAATAPLLHVEYSTGGQTNQAPTVDAGTNATITLPATATLDGTVTDDGLPSSPGAVTTTWSRDSGPGTVTFGNANAVDTTATFSTAGMHVLRLTATDGALTASDTVTITVQPAASGNTAPVVEAGANQTITLPSNATLDATVTDDGLPNPPGAVTTTWTQDSGPGTVSFGNANAVDTSASFSTGGTYVLRLTADDSALTASDTVTVQVQDQAPGNTPPVVDAGTNQSVTLPASASLDGTVTDDGLPNPPGTVTTTWSTFSGPGTVTFGNVNAVDTTASFSAAGTYVLRLTANDSAASVSDDVTVTVAGGTGGATVFEKRVAAGSDDAEQRVTGANDLTSSDLELTTDGSAQQVVGMRFTGVTVPRGATVTDAWIQFRVDEVSTGASSLTVRAENADNTPTYTTATNNVTGRATTAASVAWSPPDWPTVGAAAAAQRTPNLASLVQAVVNRTGWAAGNAMAFQVSGTGRRTAEAFEGGATFAPLLHVEYSGGASGPVNQAPTVDAGPNRGVTLPAAASLDGTVTDDGLPTTPGAVTTTWSQVSGPGTATFQNASLVDTTATFSAAGTYVLRLTANDGALSAFDEMTVVAQAAGGGGTGSADLRVLAGSDDVEQSVNSGSTQTSSSDLELTTDGNTQQVVGIRIANVPVPAGATITAAYLQFTTDEVSTGASALSIRAETADNAATYTGTVNAVTGRATTAASVPWAPADWTTVGQATTAQRTPDLSPLVNAVVSRSGWVPGNAIAFQVSGTGRRTARAFESGASVAPLLHVEWSTG